MGGGEVLDSATLMSNWVGDLPMLHRPKASTRELSALMHRASCGPAEARKVLREWRWGVATIAGVLAVVAVARLRRSS